MIWIWQSLEPSSKKQSLVNEHILKNFLVLRRNGCEGDSHANVSAAVHDLTECCYFLPSVAHLEHDFGSGRERSRCVHAASVDTYIFGTLLNLHARFRVGDFYIDSK